MNGLDQKINEAENALSSLNDRRKDLIEKIALLKQEKQLSQITPTVSVATKNSISINNHSSEKEKIDLFLSLFRGRIDVFPKRFENKKTGKSGYSPACNNEWISGFCNKPKIKCSECHNQQFIPVSEKIIRNHLIGSDSDSHSKIDYVIGVYPLLQDDSCCFLAIDFDKSNWQNDVAAFLDITRELNIPASLERSRSGNGGHIWIFFSEPIAASLARKMGSYLLTLTMEKRPEINFDSYDRFFPSQDFMPKGGFGNLIALPLQKKARAIGNSVFIDYKFVPYEDQWNYLGSIRRLTKSETEVLVCSAALNEMILDVKTVSNEDCEEPWQVTPSKKKKLFFKPGELTLKLKLVH